MRVAVGVVTILVAVAGCGGGSDKPRHEAERGAAGGEEAERVEAVKGVDKRDLTAFYQVALAAGQLRQWAASRGRLGRSTLGEARTRLRHVHPENGKLERARRAAAAAVDEALRGGTPRAALARSDRLRALIDGVVRSDPRFGALVPD